jgi:hypothetical protein
MVEDDSFYNLSTQAKAPAHTVDVRHITIGARNLDDTNIALFRPISTSFLSDED